MDAKKQYALWRAQRLPDDLAAELAAMAGNADAIEGAFGAELQFGTAGMRGIMGAGTNRLNQYTVRRAAQGLAAWLAGTKLPQRCAIGYDTRHQCPGISPRSAPSPWPTRGIEAWLYDRARADTDAVLRRAGAGLRLRHHDHRHPQRQRLQRRQVLRPRRLPDDRRARRRRRRRRSSRIRLFHPRPSTALDDHLATGRIQMIRQMTSGRAYYDPRPGKSPCSRRSSPGPSSAPSIPPCAGRATSLCAPSWAAWARRSPSSPARSSPTAILKPVNTPTPRQTRPCARAIKLPTVIRPDFIFGTDPDC